MVEVKSHVISLKPLIVYKNFSQCVGYFNKLLLGREEREKSYTYVNVYVVATSIRLNKRSYTNNLTSTLHTST